MMSKGARLNKVPIELVGSRKVIKSRDTGGGVFRFTENGRFEFGTFPLYAVYCDKVRVDPAIISTEGKLLEFFAREMKNGKSVWANILMHDTRRFRKPISVETDSSQFFKCRYYSPYVCIGHQFFEQSEASEETSTGAVKDQPSFEYDESNLLNPAFTQGPRHQSTHSNPAFQPQRNQQASFNANNDQAQRNNQNQVFSKAQPEVDRNPTFEAQLSRENHLTRAYQEFESQLQLERKTSANQMTQATYQMQTRNGNQPYNPDDSDYPVPEKDHRRFPPNDEDILSRSRVGNFSSRTNLENFPRSDVGNYSRTDVGNFPDQPSNKRDFSRFENERSLIPRNPVDPKIIPVHSIFESAPRPEAGRDLDSRHFSESEFENRRVVVKTDRPDVRAPERDRALPVKSGPDDESLISAETLFRRVIINFANNDPGKPIVLNLSDLEIGLNLSRILSRDIRLFVNENKNSKKVQELAQRFDLDLTFPDEKTSTINIDDFSPKLAARNVNSQNQSVVTLDEDSREGHDSLDAIHRRMRPKSEVDIQFALRDQEQSSRNVASSSRPWIESARSELALNYQPSSSSYFDRTRTLDSGRGPQSLPMGGADKWRSEQDWSNLRKDSNVPMNPAFDNSAKLEPRNPIFNIPTRPEPSKNPIFEVSSNSGGNNQAFDIPTRPEHARNQIFDYSSRSEPTNPALDISTRPEPPRNPLFSSRSEVRNPAYEYDLPSRSEITNPAFLSPSSSTPTNPAFKLGPIPTEPPFDPPSSGRSSWAAPNPIRALKRRSTDPVDEASGGMYRKSFNPFSRFK